MTGGRDSTLHAQVPSSLLRQGGTLRAEFPTLFSDGAYAKKKTVVISTRPLMRYRARYARNGGVHFDDRFKEAGGAPKLSKNLLSMLSQFQASAGLRDIYITIGDRERRDVNGRSGEMAITSALAGHNNLVTGLIDSVSSSGGKINVRAGHVLGVNEKQRANPALFTPKGQGTSDHQISGIVLNM